MAVITSAQSGNFTATSTWVGGVVPTSIDDAVAATGHVVTIDANVTVLSFQQAGTGKFVLGNGRTVTGNVIANAGTFTSGGTVEVTATTSATINGNLTGVSSTVANSAGVVMTGTGTLTINGSITGSAGNAVSGMLYTNVTCTLNINGNLQSGSGQTKSAILTGASSNATITIIGNINSPGIASGSAANAVDISGNAIVSVTGQIVSGDNPVSGNIYGIMMRSGGSLTVTGSVTAITPSSAIVATGNPTITVTGNVTGTSQATGGVGAGIETTGASTVVSVTGNVTGGTGLSRNGIVSTGASSTVTVIGSATGVSTLSHGVRSDATANGVIFQGDMTDSPQGAVAVYTRIFRMTATNNGVTRYVDNSTFPSGSMVSRVSPNNVTGMAATNNVRSGTVYGFNNELTGTVAIPPAQSVRFGVPVDNTTGTAELDLGRVAQIIGLQVAAGATEGTSL